MSVLIKDMEKPKSCYAVIDGEFEYCPFVNTDVECVLLLKKGICEDTWERQYSKCPIVETPEPCEDAVSRQRLLNDLKELTAAWGKYPVMAEQIKGVETAIKYVATIPFVTPKRKKGKWIPQDRNKHYGMTSTAVYYFPKCSVCGENANYTNFCPNCGADMREDQDDQSKR